MMILKHLEIHDPIPYSDEEYESDFPDVPFLPLPSIDKCER